MATLLVAVVGATFAYFTATATGGDKGGSEVSVGTAKVSNVNVTASPESITNFETIYPGVWLAAGVGVKAEYEGDHDNDYKVTYTLNGSIDLSALKQKNSTSSFTYNIYKVTGDAVTEPVTDCAVSTSGTSGLEMSVNSCALDTNLKDTNKLFETDQTLDITTDSDGKFEITKEGLELDVEEIGAAGVHYYLILKYANDPGSNQATTDQGKDIKLQLSGVTGTKVSLKS